MTDHIDDRYQYLIEQLNAESKRLQDDLQSASEFTTEERRELAGLLDVRANPKHPLNQMTSNPTLNRAASVRREALHHAGQLAVIDTTVDNPFKDEELQKIFNRQVAFDAWRQEKQDEVLAKEQTHLNLEYTVSTPGGEPQVYDNAKDAALAFHAIEATEQPYVIRVRTDERSSPGASNVAATSIVGYKDDLSKECRVGS